MVASRIEEAEEIYELARAEYIMSIEKMSLGRTDLAKIRINTDALKRMRESLMKSSWKQRNTLWKCVKKKVRRSSRIRRAKETIKSNQKHIERPANPKTAGLFLLCLN